TSIIHLRFRIHEEESLLINADNVIFPHSRVNHAYRYTMEIPVYGPAEYSTYDMNRVTHKQFRYPTSFIYNMSVR
ncbi:MAG TPA: hypothetical protein PLW63_09580, partial [Bacillota bacterium]|nr:hypothetical protein [Bacillota bacterium]